MASSISLRPIGSDDEPFLRAVYNSTRQAELSLVPWTEEEKASFLDMQFAAQHRYYHEQFPDAAFQLILLDDVPVGRLYVDRRPDEVRIIDIALVDAARNQGIGTSLLQGIIDEAEQRGVPLTIHVERFNPALRLYRRLGFEPIADQGVYLLLRRLPLTPIEPAPSPLSSSEAASPMARTLFAGEPQ
jgi:GNAT superfamily N-acetyltransferase